jgi:hypothetical protein
MTKKAYFFIGTDRATHAGYADYMQALGIALQGIDAEVYAARTSGGLGHGITRGLPTDNTGYDMLPALDMASVRTVMARYDDIHVIALGQPSLQKLEETAHALSAGGKRIESSAVLHMVDEGEVARLWMLDATIYAPIETAPQNLDLVTLPSVPHTGTLTACQAEAAKFARTQNGQIMAQINSVGAAFACAVVNAGFAGTDGNQKPYTAREAFAHGFALGRDMAPNTHLLLMHGGPRNLKDEEAGEKTLDAFQNGYLRGQGEQKYAPKVLSERFNTAAKYNAIKAAIALTHQAGCAGFISNAEGYGTMDAALALTPAGLPLAMFPFAAEEQDPTGQRRTNTQKYNALGIDWLEVDAKGQLQKRYGGPRAAIKKTADPARIILEKLGVIEAPTQRKTHAPAP